MLTPHKHTKVLGNKIDNHPKMLEYSAVTTCVNHTSLFTIITYIPMSYFYFQWDEIQAEVIDIYI